VVVAAGSDSGDGSGGPIDEGRRRLVSVPVALDLSDQLPPGGIEREVLDPVVEDRRIEQAGFDERSDER